LARADPAGRLKAAILQPGTRIIPVAIVGIALLVFPFVVKDAFWQNLAVLVLIYASAATAWNILGGFTGQISFGHAFFFAIGAYTTGYLLIHQGWLPWFGMAVGAVLAAMAGVAIGFPVFRLRNHYFSIATIAMQQVAFILVVNNVALGSATGLELPLKPESLANLQFSIRDKTEYHLVALGLFTLCALVAWLFMHTRPGYYVRAIRDDEEAARVMGVPVRRYKLYAMALSASLTALAGGLYAMYALFIDPNVVLTIGQSIQIALIAILGGSGSLWGPLIGAVVLNWLQQTTRVQLSGGGNGLDFVVYGALVMIVAILEPRGLVGFAARLRSLAARVRR
jgi:branched-chain amino acid transport system permease protein